jgi:YegS/Rv2252/BmrU family lipid kinase
MKRLVIVNRHAGRRRASRSWDTVAAQFDPRITTVAETRGPGHASDLARSLAANEIVVVGGDGTFSEVLTGLRSGVDLALLPFGTGNDLARALNIPQDPKSAAKVALSGPFRTLDAYRWESTGSKGVGANIAGTGFDAVVADRINRGMRFLTGTSAYVAAVLDCLRTFKASEVRISVDGERIEAKAMLVAIANSSSYGGGMRIAPEARLEDGLLDIVIVGEVSKPDFLRTFPKVFSGTHLSHPAVRTMRGTEVVLESYPPLPVLCDGEVVGSGWLKVAVVPSGFRLRVP